MTTRCKNFSPGPTGLPLPVLERIQAEWQDWQETGSSLVEISHRHPKFLALAEKTQAHMRALLDIPNNYHVLFLQGGARMQYAMLPLNCGQADQNKSMAYIDSGIWAQKALQEAKRIGTVNVVASAETSNYQALPTADALALDADTAYVHYISNETVQGLEFKQPPTPPESIPLVADMTSDLMTKPLDVSQFGCIYAATQKNLGISGLTVVIIEDSFMQRASTDLPEVIQYRSFADANSLWLTPNTFAWYVTSLMLDWIDEQGGIATMQQSNQKKSKALYAAIDQSELYQNDIEADSRSTINVPFTFNQPGLEAKFLQQANQSSMTGLKGHFLVGGCRASLYNAVSLEDVEALIDFMQAFETENT